MLQTPPTADQPKKSRRLLPLLSGVLIVAILASALVFSMNASSVAHAASVTKPASSLGLTQVTSTVLTTASRNSAGDPCKWFTSELWFGYLGHTKEMWLKVVTYFCYNYSIVTYHKTSWSWGVTAGGAGDGWGWIINPYYSFNCFNAADNAYRPCSGNHEWTQELFINGFLRGEASLTIDQDEYYNGGTYNHFNAHFCPGGC
jgi:hypothetical protein